MEIVSGRENRQRIAAQPPSLERHIIAGEPSGDIEGALQILTEKPRLVNTMTCCKKGVSLAWGW
ncbi:MAG: hypothetical protein R3E79_07780 [Caldilineaceae bacterium]